MRVSRTDLIDGGTAVAVTWDDGRSARFHALWLRDNALDAATRSPGNGQRLITLLDIPLDTIVSAAEATPDGSLVLTLFPGNHASTFPADWLFARVYDRVEARTLGWTRPPTERWDATLKLPAPIAFDDLRADRSVLHAWLAGLRRHGLARASGLPRHSGAVCRVAELFGHVRETNYGRWFDVRSEIDPVNLAYTSLGLQPHTDNPYRDPVPTLQLLACLDTDLDGGDSLVVDGFSAALRLQHENPSGFELLAGHCARFEYASAGIRLNAKKPVIELALDGELVAIRFNNRSAAALVDVPYDSIPGYYTALRRFAELIEDPVLTHKFRLMPGDLFIVDNTRVLHGRTAFSGSGRRWLQGCYADRDAVLSRLAAREET
jgi:gamma-butyrobetaine hydroxylase